MPTPHNSAAKEQIAKTVLMPGDPLRAKYIAENFLTDAKLVNNVRGIQGYTGKYKNKEVTVMASGMGMPSMGIYSWELFKDYDVDAIIRVGSAGGISDDIQLRDVIAAQAVSVESGYLDKFRLPGAFSPIADFGLLTNAVAAAKELGVDMKVGNVLSSDNFYYPENAARTDDWKKMGILAVEMESAALYSSAAYFGKKALCIYTVSDHLYREEIISPEERETGFNKMIEIALWTTLKSSTAQ